MVQKEVEVLELLSSGMKKRRVRKTNMNSISSRSHAIFTIYLEIRQSASEIRKSALNLVDLAGSEGFQKTGNTGEAQAEGQSINKGLSAFKRVIDAIIRGDKYIPYRDDFITLVLKGA